MPLAKRVLFELDSYRHLEQFQDAEQPPTLESRTFSSLLGACRQLSFLSVYALETFQNITALADDVNERVKVVTIKTDKLMAKISEVDRHVRNSELHPDLSFLRSKSKPRPRDAGIPPLFVKATLPPGLEMQYNYARAPPQLWRIEALCGSECFTKYSFPGYFFQQWLTTEVLRQEQERVEMKKSKAIKKQQRMERKRLKEERALAIMSGGRPKSLLKASASSVPKHMSFGLPSEPSTADALGAEDLDAPEPGESDPLPPLPQPLPPVVEASSPVAPAPTGGVLKRKGITAVFKFLSTKDKDKGIEKGKHKGKERERIHSQDSAEPEDRDDRLAEPHGVPPQVHFSADTAAEPRFAAQPPPSGDGNLSDSPSVAKPRKRPSVSMDALSLQLLTGTSRHAATTTTAGSVAEKDRDAGLPAPGTHERPRSSIHSAQPASASDHAPTRPPAPRPSEPPKLPHYKDLLVLENAKLTFSEEAETNMLALPTAPRKKLQMITRQMLRKGEAASAPRLVSRQPSGGTESILNTPNALVPAALSLAPPSPARLPAQLAAAAAGTAAQSVVDESVEGRKPEEDEPPTPRRQLPPRVASDQLAALQAEDLSVAELEQLEEVIEDDEHEEELRRRNEREEEKEEDEEEEPRNEVDTLLEALRQDILQSYDFGQHDEGAQSVSAASGAGEEEDDPLDLYAGEEGLLDQLDDPSVASQTLSAPSSVSRGAPRPPPPPPQRASLQSTTSQVRPPPPPPPKPALPQPNAIMGSLLNTIKQGRVALRTPSISTFPAKLPVQQNEAVAAILANRSKIAGDSESDGDSDDDYTDDGYG